MKDIKKIVVANRGEIAVRIMRSCREMGITTVAVFSEPDENAVFVREADEAYALGGVSAAESYLDQDKIIDVVKKSGADAIHPGYGFLSENAGFAKKCEENGVIFIGPASNVIDTMGSKVNAKKLAKDAGVPVIPGYEGKQDAETFKAEANKMGYPVLLKASAGGGGKGMRIVNSEKELVQAFESAQNEAEKSFGDGKLLLEKYFPSAKHIEVQIFGDEHGNQIHLFERECSVQRRYQKIIEESPSPSLDDKLREEICGAAVSLAKSINYTNAGTVEFILDENKNFYFLEVNTRLQVEHPVTEEVTGLDLVKLQIEVAMGLPLREEAMNAEQDGHAVECRIYAEDPENNFFPSTGTLVAYEEGGDWDTRHDSGLERGSKIDVHYDPMISKVITYAETRDSAILKMISSLNDSAFLGLRTNKDFLVEILEHQSFRDGSFDTKFIENNYTDWKQEYSDETLNSALVAAMLARWGGRRINSNWPNSLNGWRNSFYQAQFDEFAFREENYKVWYSVASDNQFKATIGDTDFDVKLLSYVEDFIECEIDGHRKSFIVATSEKDTYVVNSGVGSIALANVPRFVEPGSTALKGGYAAPMPGEILKVLVKAGDKVKSGDRLIVMNSMKMETSVEAHSDGEVEEVLVEEKAFVEADTVLLKMKA